LAQVKLLTVYATQVIGDQQYPNVLNVNKITIVHTTMMLCMHALQTALQQN